MSVTSWFLVSSSGTRHRLPPEMIFVGREECELMLQSRSVDKQHAVVNYNPATDEHMVKDLGSLNGTFVNDLRIPDETYITLMLSDVIRFGYDILFQHKVPEEALKHEKYTSQLQMSMKALEARKKEKERQHAKEKTRDSSCFQQEKVEHKAALAAGKTLFNSQLQLFPSPPLVSGSLSDSQAKTIYSHHREPSYFEIPTKEFQQQELHEVPTKDTDPPSVPVFPPVPTSTPPVVQSHASFTIEFDECTPSKIKIKDHVTKFSLRQQRKLPGKEVVTAPTEVISAECKVADWLVQSDVSMMRSSQTEDMFSSKSGLPICNEASTGHHHEDGTRRDSEDPVVNGKQAIQLKPPMGPHTSLPPQLALPRPFTNPDSEEPQSHSPPPSQDIADPQQGFVIEFFDDNPRKKRSQYFTNNTGQLDSPALRNKPEKRCGPSTPTQQYTIPLKGPGSGGPQRAGSLRREKMEDRTSNGISSCSVPPRPFRSVGRRSKLAQDFTAEFLRESRQESRPSMNTTWEKNTSPVSPTTSPPPTVEATAPHPHQTTPSLGKEEDDTLSEAGTYTIETEVQDKEVEEARSKIEQASLFALLSVVVPGGSKWVSRWANLADSYTHSGPASGLFEIPSQMDLSGGATLTKQQGGQDFQKTVKLNSSAPKLDYQGRVSPQPKEISVSLVRQESFIKDQPSDAAQVTRLPHISSQPALSDPDPAEAFQGVCSQDTHSYLNGTEDSLAALEAKLQAQPPDVAPRPIEYSLSGESDMDSASTASLCNNQTAPKTGSKKPFITSGLQRERSSTSSFTQEPSRQQTTLDRLSEKRRSQGVDSSRKPEQDRRLGMRCCVVKHGTMDLSDDPQSFSLPYWPETISSDQEGSRPAACKKYTVPLQKVDPTKSSKVAQALSRSNSMSAPRPTRASMLRRAHLGEASDNEVTETDRISLNSQDTSGTTKVSQDSKKQLSRLDMLALPRKRTSSFTTPSDTESSAPRTGFSNRSTESNSGSGLKASVAGPSTKPALGRASGAPGKLITRFRSSSAKYTSSTATSRSQPLIPPRPKPRSRDSDQESHEGDAYQNCSSHSAEIARLSQGLAKDLSVLAREIHDVTGDADPQSSSAVEANTPVSTITAREVLVHPIPEAGVNYLRVPPGSTAARNPDQTIMNDQEYNSKDRGWNQEVVVVDDLMLNPVSQISLAIRENTEQLAEKIKVLFHNKTDVWGEIESKLNTENDIPVLKGSNKEITAILKELRRVQRQLEVINTIIEPSGNLEPAKASTPSAPSSAGLKPSRAPSRYWRTSGSQRGGVPSASSRPSESVRRSVVASEAESYVV
uniref:Centrosomal protein 170B n=1 Tax=Salmo trutta TaxID=8032 RepID=A0A673Z037_SALTR